MTGEAFRCIRLSDGAITKKLANIDPNCEYIFVILKFPRRKPSLRSRALSPNPTSHKNKAIEGQKRCIEVLVNKYHIDRRDIEMGRNIFCPIHENRSTSKTASGKVSLAYNSYTCFSSSCTLPVNEKTGFRQVYLDKLFQMLDR